MLAIQNDNIQFINASFIKKGGDNIFNHNASLKIDWLNNHKIYLFHLPTIHSTIYNTYFLG